MVMPDIETLLKEADKKGGKATTLSLDSDLRDRLDTLKKRLKLRRMEEVVQLGVGYIEDMLNEANR